MSTGVGGRIREAMRLNGMSARQVEEILAARGGEYVNRVTLGLYMREQRSPTARLLLELAGALGVRAEWLLTGSGSVHPAAGDDAERQAVPAEGAMLPFQTVPSFREAVSRTLGVRGQDPALNTLADFKRAQTEAAAALYEYLCAFVVGSLETYTPGLGKSDGAFERVNGLRRANATIDVAYSDGLQLLLMAHERLRSVAYALIYLERDGGVDLWEATKAAAVRGKSVAKGHTKTGKGRKQPTSRKR